MQDAYSVSITAGSLYNCAFSLYMVAKKGPITAKETEKKIPLLSHF